MESENLKGGVQNNKLLSANLQCERGDDNVSGEDSILHPIINDSYREKLLEKMQIYNNTKLNKHFYEHFIRIPSKLLLQTDFSGEDEQSKTIGNYLLSEDLLKTHPEPEAGIDYTEQFNSLALANLILQKEIQRLMEEQVQFQRAKKRHLQDSETENNLKLRFETPTPKRRRRTANEIDRPFACPVQSCGKCYGTEGSLNQHIKLKHPENTRNGTTGGSARKSSQFKV